MTSIAIIGAGLSGLTAANRLKNAADITRFEKSCGVGGRMSTRRAELFLTTAHNFSRYAPMINSGIVARWDARFAEVVDGAITQQNNQWFLQDEQGESLVTFDWVIQACRTSCKATALIFCFLSTGNIGDHEKLLFVDAGF